MAPTWGVAAVIGTTLGDIRSSLEALANEDGSYYLVCARTGDRPVPSGDLRFANRVSARAAATATEQYRAALRRYDPQLPYYDVVACEASEDGRDADLAETPAAATHSWRPGPDLPDATGPGSSLDSSARDRSALVECCHRVAAVVFEALSAAGHDDVESAVMDAYVDLAETVEDPDELCCCLLECMAVAIDEALTPSQQAAVVADAVDRQPAPAPTDRPLSATLHGLQSRGLLSGHARSPWSSDREEGSRSVVVLVDGYALSPRDGRLPVLPVAVELFRRQTDWRPATLDVVALEVGWKLELTLGGDAQPRGLASAPIRRSA